MVKWLTKDGAYQDTYDQGEIDRLKGHGWVLIPGTPFQHVQALRKEKADAEAKKAPAVAGGENAADDAGEAESREALVAAYKEKFGKGPGRLSDEKIKAALAE